MPITEAEINEALKNIHSEPELESYTGAGESSESQSIQITPDAVARSLQPLSNIVARKFKLESIKLTDDDVHDLTNALLPFADQLNKLAQYMIFLPLLMFAGAYAARIWTEIKHKKESESSNAGKSKSKKKDKPDKKPEAKDETGK